MIQKLKTLHTDDVQNTSDDNLSAAIINALDNGQLQNYTTEDVLSEEKLYDLTMLESMDDKDYLVEIISIFLSETPRELKEMHLAAIAKKAGIVSGKAHKLKSNSGILEAYTFTAILQQVETRAKSENQPEEVIKLVEAAQNEYLKIERSLKNYLKDIR